MEVEITTHWQICQRRLRTGVRGENEQWAWFDWLDSDTQQITRTARRISRLAMRRTTLEAAIGFCLRICFKLMGDCPPMSNPTRKMLGGVALPYRPQPEYLLTIDAGNVRLIRRKGWPWCLRQREWFIPAGAAVEPQHMSWDGLRWEVQPDPEPELAF